MQHLTYQQSYIMRSIHTIILVVKDIPTPTMHNRKDSIPIASLPRISFSYLNAYTVKSPSHAISDGRFACNTASLFYFDCHCDFCNMAWYEQVVNEYVIGN